MCKDKARIRMCGRMSATIPMIAVEGQYKNSKMFIRTAPEFNGRSKFQCVQKQGQNSNVWKNKIIISMLIKRGPKFHCLDE